MLQRVTVGIASNCTQGFAHQESHSRLQSMPWLYLAGAAAISDELSEDRAVGLSGSR
jgi:hypothetical protein